MVSESTPSGQRTEIRAIDVFVYGATIQAIVYLGSIYCGYTDVSIRVNIRASLRDQRYQSVVKHEGKHIPTESTRSASATKFQIERAALAS